MGLEEYLVSAVCAPPNTLALGGETGTGDGRLDMIVGGAGGGGRGGRGWYGDTRLETKTVRRSHK